MDDAIDVAEAARAHMADDHWPEPKLTAALDRLEATDA